jgi:vacuolar-type H+-ATPase subunit H
MSSGDWSPADPQPLRLASVPDEEARKPDIAALGVHITSVLEAAEAAAEKLRGDAEAEADAVRADADRYAEARRQQADEEAARVVGDAERRAFEVEQFAVERHRTLIEDIASSEQRMGVLADSLQAVAGQLREVAGDKLPLEVRDSDQPLRADAEAAGHVDDRP